MRSAMASASCGPSPQFTPMASAPQSRSVVATCSGVEPSATVSLGLKAIDAMIGSRARPPRRLDRDAQLLQVPEGLEHEQVDAALDERRRLLGEGGRHRVELGGLATPGTRPVGPMEPATQTSSPAALRPAGRRPGCRRAPGRPGHGGPGRTRWRRRCWSR
jgi:hypothetical protein